VDSSDVFKTFFQVTCFVADIHLFTFCVTSYYTAMTYLWNPTGLDTIKQCKAIKQIPVTLWWCLEIFCHSVLLDFNSRL